MFKKIIPAFLSVFLLSGCASSVKVDHFGGQQAFDKALVNPETPILIGEFGTLNPNSAGGVNVQIQMINSSPKTIKYISFKLSPFNKVGDRTSDRITRRGRKSLRYIGPLEPGFTNAKKELYGQNTTAGYWENVWYNHSIACATIDEVEVTYMDDTKVHIKDTTPLMTRDGKCRHFRYN